MFRRVDTLIAEVYPKAEALRSNLAPTVTDPNAVTKLSEKKFTPCKLFIDASIRFLIFRLLTKDVVTAIQAPLVLKIFQGLR